MLLFTEIKAITVQVKVIMLNCGLYTKQDRVSSTSGVESGSFMLGLVYQMAHTSHIQVGTGTSGSSHTAHIRNGTHISHSGQGWYIGTCISRQVRAGASGSADL